MTTQIDFEATNDALRDSTERVATLLRQVPDPGARAGTLDWTIAETAAHIIGGVELFTGFISGERDAHAFLDAATGASTPAERSAYGNARMLEEITERDTSRLAAMLTDAVDRFIKTAADADRDTAHMTEFGVAMTPPEMSAAHVGEMLIHGFDIARGAHKTWKIPRDEALLVINGIMATVPEYVNKKTTAGKHVSYELRFRGGPRYRMQIDDGSAVVSEAGDKVDCWISADPVAFLLVGYGRIGQWGPVLRGQLLSGGRKPWLGMQFGSLLTSV